MMRILKTSLIALLGFVALICAADGAAADGWKKLPVVPRITGATEKGFKRDLVRSKARGMRGRVFAKVGDSNTEMAPALYGLACRKPVLNGRWRLRKVINRYNQVTLPGDRAMEGCSPTTSFSRRSVAAKSMTWVVWSLQDFGQLPAGGPWAAPDGCEPFRTTLSCEIAEIHPRYTLIMTGTNDYTADNYFDVKPGSRITQRTSRLVRTVRRLGSIPILSTLPPIRSADVPPGAIDSSNAAIAITARKLSVPVINLWRSLQGKAVVNQGVDPEGYHLGVKGGGISPIETPGPTTLTEAVDFSPDGLRYGSNRRNLVWLQVLAALDRAAARIKTEDGHTRN